MSDSTIIEGLIIPAQWGEDGRVNAVIISTFDEREYRVQTSSIGDELMNQMQKRVRAKGRIGKDDRTRLYIDVVDYTIIELPTARQG